MSLCGNAGRALTDVNLNTVILHLQVLEMGIETYNKHCRGIVTRYSKEWERTIKRLGRWIDFENDYKTMVRTDTFFVNVPLMLTYR